jgi:superfamily II DNA or RNA helicase
MPPSSACALSPPKALDRFKASSEAVLVATDVAARGLDIRGVDCVIHYQLSATADTYIHRSGRTGRAEAAGGRKECNVSDLIHRVLARAALQHAWL